MNRRILALWILDAVLIGGAFAASWSAAVGTSERYAQFAAGGSVEEPAFDWAGIVSALSAPLFIAGLSAVLVTLAVQALLWRPAPRE